MAALRSRVWLLAGLVAASLACSRGPTFRGNAMDPPRPALDFSLVDQSGQPVRLSSLRGRVVGLTFLYTWCPDLCPLVADKLRQVSERLGARRGDVVLLVVTADPGRDTVARAAEYSRQWGMQDRWRFLTGPERELQPVWQYYWVGQVARRPVSGNAAAPYEDGHAAPVHLIDRSGQVRVAFSADFRPDELAHDIEALIASR